MLYSPQRRRVYFRGNLEEFTGVTEADLLAEALGSLVKAVGEASRSATPEEKEELKKVLEGLKWAPFPCDQK